MNKRLIAVAMCWALVCAAGQAQTTSNSIVVNYSGGTGGTPNIVNSTGTTPVPDGNYVEIGYFNPGFATNVGASTASLVALNNEWHLFGQTVLRPLPFTNSTTLNLGRFGASASSFVATFGGKEIDLWIFHTSDNGPPLLPSFSNVIEYGLFTKLGTTGPPIWDFPAAGVAPGNTLDISTADVDHSYFGFINSGLSLELEAIPEPSTASFVGLGLALAWFATRRSPR